MIYYVTATTMSCGCQKIRSSFRVFGMYNFGFSSDLQLSAAAASALGVTPKPKKLITFDRISPPNQFRQIDEILRCMLG